MPKTYNFDDKTEGTFTINNSAFDDQVGQRAQSGSYSGGVSDDLPHDPAGFATWEPWDGEGRKVKEIEFYYQEDYDSYGGGLRLINSNGNYECGFATDNAAWKVSHSSGVSKINSYSDYDVWVRVKVTFDWSNDEFTVTYEGPYGSSTTKTFSLKYGIDVKGLVMHNFKSGSWDTSDNCYMWWDSLYADGGTSSPSSPQNVSAKVDSNDKISLSWDPPSDWGGEEGNYKVHISRDSNSYTGPSGGPTTPGSGTASATYGPNSDNSYDSQVGIDSSFRFRVRAENSAGNSGWTYSGTVYTTPTAPKKPSISRPDANTVEISWTSNTDIGSNARTDIEYRKDTGSGYSGWSNVETISASSKGTRRTKTYSVSSDGFMQVDARYQFRIAHYLYQDTDGDGNSTLWESPYVYADYGNEGNIYFEDDFESGDLSNWGGTSLNDAQSGIRSGSNGDLGISGADQGTYYVRLDGGDWIKILNSWDKEPNSYPSDTDIIVKAVVAAGSLDSASETTKIQWYDGSSWNNLRTFGPEYNKQGWFEVSVIVPSSLISSNVDLRLLGYGGGGDYLAVDRVVVSDILHEYTKPSAPTNLVSRSTGTDSLELGWTDNASFEDRYEILYRQTGSVSWTRDHNEPSNSESGVINGLPKATRFELKTRDVVEQPRNGSINSYWYHDNIHPNISTALAETMLNTPSGNVKVPVFDLQDVQRDFMRTKTPNGIGALNFVPTSDADLDQVRIYTESYGTLGLKSETENN